MIHGSDRPILLTAENSAHIETEYGSSWMHPEYGNCHSFNLYKNLTFKEKGLVATHTFPVFTDIRTHLLDTHIVLIRPSVEDINEIVFNSSTKNHLGETTGMPDVHKLHSLIPFFNIEVPKDLNNIHEIKYKEIYEPIGDSYVALEKLKEITKRDIHPNVFESYQKYVNNRNKIWIGI